MIWHRLSDYLQRRWHQFWCWQGQHVMILYQVGHNYGRECRWCRVHGCLSEEDIRRLFSNNS